MDYLTIVPQTLGNLEGDIVYVYFAPKPPILGA